ncbi:MAG: TolC family outer membrane protein [Rhodoferax sp.]|nr:TolC family outer membrane protein [Rhodoferax sp.]
MAQSPGSLRAAIEQATLQNPEVKLRYHNLQAAQHDRRAAQGGWLPRVDLEVGSGREEYKSPSVPTTQSYPSNRASLQLRQTLFDGFATQSEVRRLSYAEQAAFYELLSASNQTALEVGRAYIDVLRFRELVELAANNYSAHQEVHDRIAQKVAAGVGRRVDLEQAAGRMALAESNWLTEVSNLHDVSARYQRLVGDTPAEVLAPMDPLGEFLPVGIGFLNDATRTNPDFLGAVANIRSYRADRDVRAASKYPTLELRARAGTQNSQNGVIGEYKDSTLELVLNYNLFRGGADSARTRQSAAKLEAAFDLRDKACRDIFQTGQIAFNDSIRLVSQLKLLAQHELSTSKARQAYQQQFDIGQRSLLDLLDTENELYQARRALANAVYDLSLSDVRVLAVSGTLLEVFKLRPMNSSLPEASGGTDANDDALQCSDRIIPTLVLNRNTEARIPVIPVKSEPVPPAPPVPAPTPAKVTEACQTELSNFVDAWIGAWNRKNFAGYLAAYGDSFVPAKGLSRSDWEKLRKTRLNKKGSIRADITGTKALSCNAKTGAVSFSQSYGSDDYRDTVEKTLDLELVGKQWKIVRETVTKGRTF